MQPTKVVNPRGMSGVKLAKPYGITKRTVLIAYQQLKANRGATGVDDDETIADFEQGLSKDLCMIFFYKRGVMHPLFIYFG
jgi:hypothetical protein